jgi:hypothetical protein
LTQISSPGHVAPPASPPSTDAHGAAQCPSTQTVPPMQSGVVTQAVGSRLQTPRVRSHPYPMGHGDPAEQSGTQIPLTHDSFAPGVHCVESAQS